MKNKIFLIGIPGSGKTTLGRRTADILQIPFFDTDIMAQNNIGEVSIADIVRPSLSMSYVKEQLKAIALIAEMNTSALVATCAEVALMPKCITHMNNIGYIIHIKRDPEIIVEFIRNNEQQKLMLRNETTGTELVMQEEAVRLYAKEISEYNRVANLTLDNNGTEDEGVEKLKYLIEKLI